MSGIVIDVEDGTTQGHTYLHTASDILSQFAPCLHGFYRAITSIPFVWSIQEWTALADHLNHLFSAEVVDNLNRLLVNVLRASEEEPEEVLYIQTFLSRYISRGRPLSGYFILCCVIEAQWTILAQALLPNCSSSGGFVEAAAVNQAWQSLLAEAIPTSLEHHQPFQETVQATLSSAMKCFTSLLLQIEDMDTEPSEDSYAWETMSESLVSTHIVVESKTDISEPTDRNWLLSAQPLLGLSTRPFTPVFSCC